MMAAVPPTHADDHSPLIWLRLSVSGRINVVVRLEAL